MRLQKGLTRLVCIFFVIFLGSVSAQIPALAAPDAPDSATSFLIFEQDTQQRIQQQNADAQTDASVLARMMTALVVLESSFDGRSISVTDTVTPVSNSTSADKNYKLSASKHYTVEALIKASLLANADNCSRALAYYVNPNTDYFVSLMNQTAAKIGMTQTFFTNTDGSANQLQRTTAYDTALFYNYALKNIQFRQIVCNEVTTIWDNITVFNHCALAFSLSETLSASLAGGVYAVGKNGSASLVLNITLPAPDAGTYPLRLIAVFLGDTDANTTDYAKNLLQDTVLNYQKKKILAAGDLMDTYRIAGEKLKLIAGSDLYCVMPKDLSNYVQNISYTFTDGTDVEALQTEELKPPIAEGQQLGTARFLLRDGSAQQVSIFAGNSIQTQIRAVNRFLDLYTQYKPLFILIFFLILCEIALILLKCLPRLRAKKSL